ncbi:MAG: hypothetical protein M1133_02730 [Armatimonadetes bacterium]|nr:hypothetical protein [Armatimonadota bacterium]
MLGIVLWWTEIWWILDGFGLIIWAVLARPRWLIGLAAAQIVLGLAGLITNRITGMIGLLFVTLVLAGLVGLTLLRYSAWWKHLMPGWSQHWRSIGEPAVWQGWWVLFVVIVALIAAIVQVMFRDEMGYTERSLWAWSFAASIAGATSPGGFGLGANFVARWALRISTVIGFCMATWYSLAAHL